MQLDQLPTRQRNVITAIIEAPRAWASRRAISHDAHTRSGPVLERLKAMDWVDHWDHARDGRELRQDLWTLTPLGAEWAGVQIDEERDGEPRWFAVPISTPIHSHGIQIPYPERIPDPHPPVEYLADLDTGATTTLVEDAMKIQGVPIRVNPPRPRHPGTRHAR